MSLDDFLRFISQALYVVIFLFVLRNAILRPRSATINIALFFGAAALVVSLSWLTQVAPVIPAPIGSMISASLLLALPYLLLRLVNDFATVPVWLLRAAEAGLVAVVLGMLIEADRRPGWLILALIAYFFVLIVYCAVRFVQAARRSAGVTQRRMQAVATGSFGLGVAIVAAGLRASFPALHDLWMVLYHVSALTSGLAYFVGFAPPSWLRRAWQEPELRAFLARAAALPRLPDTRTIVRELEQGAAASLGSPLASIGLWDTEAQRLHFVVQRSGAPYDLQPGEMVAGRAFAARRPVFSEDAPREDPAHAEVYAAYDVHAVLAAPITAGDNRLGVLVVTAPRAPIFAEDDLVLVQLLADQAAVILESRALIDEAARVQAREEATRLKDDFLSAAAHDLKTPLTTLVALTQLMERRIARDPAAPADATTVHRLTREAQRLKRLVLELLDATRVEEGRLVGEREPVDLVALAHEAAARLSTPRHEIVVEASEEVVGYYDPVRVEQLIDNLLENAVKYSPQGGPIRVRLWRADNAAHLSVSDQGIGIPTGDRATIFERFHRGRNVDDRRFAGMGLGLFICRGIVEQHGGRIEVTSPGVDQGSTFHAMLPLAPAAGDRPASLATANEGGHRG